MLEVRGFAEKVKGELARQGVRAALLFLALASCHDAPRDNPFDPALTPAVALTVALDDTAGTATLTWNRYEGQQPFREYRVLRHIAERTRVDTLAHLPAVEQTTFVDTTLAPNTAYVYRVEVVNVGGYAASSEEKGVAGFSVGAVQLGEVEPNPRAGELVLRWSRYVGPDFAGYQVRRRAVGTDQEEVLAELSAVVDTSLVDSSARAGVDYLYMVVVQAAGQELLSNAQVGRLVLPAVEITQAEFNSAEAAASLIWTPYAGPHFKAYRVERRSAGLASQVLEEIPDLADTAFADRGLVGNTEYFYRVVVETERDEEIPSEEQSGAFHKLVATWELGGARSLVRLYAEGDQLVALMAPSISERRWHLFDLEGQVLDSQSEDILSTTLTQRSTATALNHAGQRVLSLSVTPVADGGTPAQTCLQVHGANRQPVMREYSLFEEVSAAPLSSSEARITGAISLEGGRGGAFDNVVVSSRGTVLFAEDFDDFPSLVPQGTVRGWDVHGIGGTLHEGKFELGAEGSALYVDPTWQDFRLEADVLVSSSNVYSSGYGGAVAKGIHLGGDTFSSFSLALDYRRQQVSLEWTFSPPAELGLESKHQRFVQPFPVFLDQPYRLSLEMAEGKLTAAVTAPLLWFSANPSKKSWTSMAALGEQLAFTLYDQAYLLSPGGAVTPLTSLEAGVGEMRAWEGRRGTQLGVCLPEANMLLIGSVPAGQEADWPTYLVNPLGPALGPPGEFLFYPLSFDVGPDGRIYVLDAGNARIVVFDSSRRYITQWGRWGKGEGEFDFGRGARGPSGELDFAGSIAVDGQGYIYVSDEINGRIQKFAP